MKWNILRCLTQVGCKVTVVPGTATAEEVLSHKPDGMFLSNGPGDPAAVGYAIDTVKNLIGKKPIFGICLGHQLLGLAFGAKTFKLKFGHRGANQPVRNELTEQVEITTQNHGFAVDPTTLPEGRRADAHQPERQHAGGAEAHDAAGVQRAVPPGGRRRPARLQLPVRGVPQADGVISLLEAEE